MPVGTCDTCGEYSDTLKYKQGGWHCKECVEKLPNTINTIRAGALTKIGQRKHKKWSDRKWKNFCNDMGHSPKEF